MNLFQKLYKNYSYLVIVITTMKLRYISDLHLEFINPHKLEKFIRNIPPGNIDEICILAGDVGNPYQANYDIFMKYISKHFRKTFVIAGNHEYYHKTKTISETKVFLRDYFQQFDNISFLDNECEIYENICFIGTTLWSKITNPEYEINDVHSIPQFDYIQYNRLNMLSVDFLENALQHNQYCVVITHHVPSDTLIDVKYKTKELQPYNQWFCCDIDEIIETHKEKIKCWIYGHTHSASNITMYDIPFLCNPVGYPNENRKINYAANITIEL